MSIHTTLTLIVSPALFLVGLQTSDARSPARDQAARVATAAPTLELVKRLEGEWVAVGEDGQPTDQVVSRFRVTAGGSAVIETIFPGAEHEMITVYHQDGDQLVLTHYCILGNQPRMKARADSNAEKLVFECAGGTNFACEDDRHMHEGTFTWFDENRINTQWLQVYEGEVTYKAGFELARRKK